jgi:aspartyl-tRNA synthetase
MRTHTLGEINDKLAGKKVELCGWVDSIRVMKSVIFVVLRDRYGKVQAVINSKSNSFDKAKGLTQESCIKINGLVKKRPKGQENKEMGGSGKVEIEINDLEIFGLCSRLPLDLKNKTNEDENRLKYRFLDLRTEKMQKNLLIRSKITGEVLRFFEKEGFVYFETPILGKSTPEGARDFLVPSRTHKGEFYALPQSPQLFKQLSMVAGFDKYIQLARCFRDEDLRADRQLEFTQVDIEMSFIEQEDILNLMEKMVKEIFKNIGIDVKTPFKRISYDEAMKKYGNDRPDIRKKGEEFAFCWVVDFPLFEYSKEDKRYKSTHHPFTMPADNKINEKSKSVAYDLVLNGTEIGGGSIRIHDPKIQEKVFDFLKISKKESREKFGFLLDALSYGAPPHGGIAFGFDRLVQIIAGEDSIKEVIAFPKNKFGKDAMLNSPNEVSKEQLDEVGLKKK